MSTAVLTQEERSVPSVLVETVDVGNRKSNVQKTDPDGSRDRPKKIENTNVHRRFASAQTV